jgi:hypothetical protein
MSVVRYLFILIVFDSILGKFFSILFLKTLALTKTGLI